MTYVINNMTYVIFIYLSTQTSQQGTFLKLPCEVAVKSVLPAIKALMATKLVDEHGMRQDEVARILGISQSAVSKYSKKVRGYVIKADEAEEVKPLVNAMTTLLLKEQYHRSELLQLFCQACESVRRTGLMCQFCERSDPKLKIEECDFCFGLVSRRR